MTNREVAVGLRITGDNKGGLEAVAGVRKGVADLKADGESLHLLEGESASAQALAGEMERLQDEARKLAEASARIQILDSAIASVDRYKAAISAADAKVRTLQATLSEAYNSGAAPATISRLEKELAAAERASKQAKAAFDQGAASLVSLNLAADKTGITTGNLAEKKAELANQVEQLTDDIAAQNAALQLEAQYQAHLADEIERLAAAEREAASNNRFEQQRQAAIAAQRAAEYTGWWARELDAVDQRQRQAANSAARLDNAFANMGIRSAKQIEADILQINQDLLLLARRADLSGAEFDRAFAAGKTRVEQLRAELKGVADDTTDVSKSTGILSGMMSRLAAVYSGMELARQFVQANVAMESMRRTLLQMTGSADAAAAEIDYLRQAANRLGLDMYTAGRSYASLMASAKGTSMEGEKTRQVFEAVAGAMSKLGRSSADTEGALQAVQQMMGKGVVSQEELRQQLAERLPGALQATAKALGMTVGDLNEMIASGQVLAEDLLPKLAQGLTEMYGTGGPPADGMVAAWNRFKNAFNDSLTLAGDSGVWKYMAKAVDGASTAVRGLAAASEMLSRTTSITMASIWSFDWKHPIDSIVNWKTSVVDAATDVQKRLNLLKDGADTAGAAQTKMAAAGQQAAASWLSVQNAYLKVAKSAEEATKQAVKSAEAREAEAKAAKGVADAFGTEAEKRVANQAAAQTEATALAAVASAREREAAIAQSQLAALTAAAEAEGKVSDAKRKAIQDSTDAAAAKQAEADKAVAQAKAAALAAEVAKTASATYQDNSTRLNELRDAYAAATLKVDELRRAKAAGKEVTEQLTAAELAAGKAAALYRDAISDQIEKIKALADAKRGELDVASAQVRLAIEEQRTIADVAKAKGNEAGAARALIEIKRLEIELADLTAKAKRAEADAALLVVKAKREEAKAAGTLTAAKEAELKAQEASANVKKVEAQIAEETAGRLKQLESASRSAIGGMNQMTGAASGAASGIDGIGDAADRASARIERLAEGVRRVGKEYVNAEGFTSNSSGSAISMEVQTLMSIAKQLEAYGVPTKDALSLAREFADENGNVAYLNNAGQKKYNGSNLYGSTSTAIAKAAEQYLVANADKPEVQQSSQAMTAARVTGREIAQAIAFSIPIQQAATAQAEANVSRVEIVLGGKKTTINTASRSDADALTGLLKQLEDEAARAS